MVKYNVTTKKGYTALFAVLVSSLILSVGIGIINITLKEIALSASGRESQFAFYAADSGAECAQYWDNKGLFTIPTTTPQGFLAEPIACFGNDAIVTSYIEDGFDITDGGDGMVATTTFDFDYVTIAGVDLCGIVEVGKYVDENGGERTIIVSNGRNTCGASSVRQLERGLVIDY